MIDAPCGDERRRAAEQRHRHVEADHERVRACHTGTTRDRGGPWYPVKSIVPIVVRPATFTITTLPSVAIRPSLEKTVA
ncbi:hypothetical protein LGM39_27915 [Burkholderia cepacia]|uniref:hypothetical protein n=1 Tax=Burkholderia cepacia TaxID=292 RepID=UPI001CF52931|nr:hypothetical protein [Burkholderia cepacia]MCA7903204.1 hypothetical protein [Burkholderia cepacia]